jgi:hypothetical protein
VNFENMGHHAVVTLTCPNDESRWRFSIENHALNIIVPQYPGLGANGVVCTQAYNTHDICIEVIFKHPNVYDDTRVSLLAKLFWSLIPELLAAVNCLRFQGASDVESAIKRAEKDVAALCAAASDLKQQIDHKNGLIVKLGGNALDVPKPPPFGRSPYT